MPPKIILVPSRQIVWVIPGEGGVEQKLKQLADLLQQDKLEAQLQLQQALVGTSAVAQAPPAPMAEGAVLEASGPLLAWSLHRARLPLGGGGETATELRSVLRARR